MSRDREEFTRKVKVAAWDIADGRCQWIGESTEFHPCQKKLFPGDINYDHIIPYAISRDSSLGNCQVLCRAHHAEKTFITDVPTIAKGKRVHANHIGAKKIARGFRKPSGTEYSWAQHRYVRISSGDDRDAQDAVERSKP